MKIYYLLKKELIEIFRQKEYIFLIFVMPLIQIFIMGYVMTTDIKKVSVEIVNLSDSPLTRQIVSRIEATPLFVVERIWSNPVDAAAILKKGKTKAIIVLRDPANRKRQMLKYPEIQILIDGVDANTSLLAAGYFNGIVQNHVQGEIEKKGYLLPVENRTVIRFNPELRSINYMGPGLVGILLTTFLLFLGTGAIVREKEQQTIDTLLISPLKPLEIYIGKALPVGLLATASMTLGLLVVRFWFGVPLRGNPAYLLVAVAVYLPAVLAYALMISTFASTQVEGMFFAFFSMITFLIFSGFLTPVENIPSPVHLITYINPTRYLMRIIREIFLKGNGIAFFWKDLLALSAITVVIVSLSLVNYRRLVSK